MIVIVADDQNRQLSAEVEGRSWDPSQTPAPDSNGSSSSLRKPRSQSSRSASPMPRDHAAAEAANPSGSSESKKAVVDTDFFAKMGATNAARPEGLRPSEGGRYAGFGSDGDSFSPAAQSTSSRALPSMDDLRSDPSSALSKGWGFFSSVSLSNFSRPNRVID